MRSAAAAEVEAIASHSTASHFLIILEASCTGRAVNHPGCPAYKMLHTFALKGGREPAPGSLLDSHRLRGKQWTGRRTRRAGTLTALRVAGESS